MDLISPPPVQNPYTEMCTGEDIACSCNPKNTKTYRNRVGATSWELREYLNIPSLNSESIGHPEYIIIRHHGANQHLITADRQTAQITRNEHKKQSW